MRHFYVILCVFLPGYLKTPFFGCALLALFGGVRGQGGGVRLACMRRVMSQMKAMITRGIYYCWTKGGNGRARLKDGSCDGALACSTR